MRFRPVLPSLCILLAVMYFASCIFQAWAKSREVKAGPENGTTFLKTYRPERVIVELYAPNTRYTRGLRTEDRQTAILLIIRGIFNRT